MTVFESIILGVVQGLAEFLPVSSSGHLAVAQALIPGFTQPGVVFDVALHLGTVAAVLALEWGRIVRAFREGYAMRLAMLLFLGTVATAAVAMPLRSRAELAFQRPLVVGVGLICTGAILLVGRSMRGSTGPVQTGWLAVVFVGLAQGAAVMPGISRSGTTIVAGAASGLEREWAADFSFLLSVPAVLGATVLEGWTYRGQIAALGSGFFLPAAIGAVTAALVGAAALVAVRRIVARGRLHLFAWYVLPLGALVVVLSLLGTLS